MIMVYLHGLRNTDLFIFQTIKSWLVLRVSPRIILINYAQIEDFDKYKRNEKKKKWRLIILLCKR